MTRIPNFTPDGVLPAGDHEATLEDLREFVREGGWSAKGREWRLHLLENLERVVHQVYAVNLDRIWVDGSFVQNVDIPRDIDAYADLEGRPELDVLLELYVSSGEDYWSLDSYYTEEGPPPKSRLWHRLGIDFFLVDVATASAWPESYRSRSVPERFRTT